MAASRERRRHIVLHVVVNHTLVFAVFHQHPFSNLARKIRNTVGSIHDEHGVLKTGLRDVADGFVAYYQNLLGTSSPVQPLPPDLFQQGLLSLDDHASLTQLVHTNEILTALKSVDRNKSPGIDGYSSGFFLDAWSVVGNDFKEVVYEFFLHGKLPKSANSTLLVLVPKLDTPSSVKDFRPIACCTTFYKVVSKILANRIQGVMDQIIEPEQAAFVAQRDLSDNAMMAYELASKYGRAYLTPRCLLKVDIRKAFDSVNWEFLQKAMLSFGFPRVFVGWVMACITSPFYSLSINGGVEGFFPGKRGLRQGDPLSPYLFVICMEVLSRLLRRLPRFDGFSYHPKCVQLNLTHLVFADDLLVFTRGDLPSVQAVAATLSLFDSLSGLQANPTKTSLYFGGVNTDLKKVILDAIGFSEGDFPFRYLGLPLFNARLATDMYQPLLDKIKGKIAHWANHSLSYAGKTLLINSIIFGMHNFWGASVFLPKGIIKKINKLCKDFLWGIDDGARRHVFLSWKAICQPKREGGIGIKEVLSWNCSQMLKWVWKLIARPQSIWALWVNRYILKGADFWSAQQSISHSWYWNNVVKVKDFLLASAGSHRITLDWISACSDSTTFHTAKMYQLVRQGAEEVHWYSLVHDLQCVPKHSFFGVLAFQNKLPTIDNLAHRGLHMVNRCALCCAHNESVEHLFFQCAFSSQVWAQIAAWLQACPSSQLDQVVSWYLTQCHGVRAGRQRAGLLATMYYLWHERNGRIFRGVLSTPESICIRVKFVVSNRSF